ncbi:hypothetical protein lacNasYZ03_16280 [Lactobacillus nasalidis]|uniref:MacB-like periplasmic core domain-containing protein n=1 Tax=Lactobacillus nasalidis TaxID=2797258 RepID=A0ABQ3W8U9_9LACO|nr:hypothetical protein [Lactobacillus nasalidis]GHV98161.1 hypothetical protein lacNasYZ01_13430 [Lactobacillus nasalidis]GHV99067.1 hypothetical protein lacNasYZ02_04970 [Lactobacillus nasalidis]GHW01941.1 hypothetical protein lacNasYZ03_16280 [Lactobacillus nasalidis]
MKRHKLFVIFSTFFLFILIGIVCSNMQSQLANQILQSQGMSMQTRIVKPKKNMTVSSFIKWVKKEYPKESIQMQFKSKSDKHQILVWAQNRDLDYFPVSSGRFFTEDDFKGQITIAAVSSATQATQIKTQGNSYLYLNGLYYTVVGNLKSVPYQSSKDYYLTTGENQATGKKQISRFTLYVDASSATIGKIAKHLSSETYWPEFVKRNRQRRLTLLMPEALLILFLTGVGIALMGLIAWVAWKEAELSHLKGELLANLLLNRSGRFIVLMVAEAIGAYFLLVWKAYFGNRGILALLLLGVTVVELAVYISMMIYMYHMYRKEKKADA